MLRYHLSSFRTICGVRAESTNKASFPLSHFVNINKKCIVDVASSEKRPRRPTERLAASSRQQRVEHLASHQSCARIRFNVENTSGLRGQDDVKVRWFPSKILLFSKIVSEIDKFRICSSTDVDDNLEFGLPSFRKKLDSFCLNLTNCCMKSSWNALPHPKTFSGIPHLVTFKMKDTNYV